MGFTDDELLAQRPNLARYARFLAGPQDAEDLVQSTLAHVLRKRDSFVTGNLRGWCIHLMHNVWVSQRRRPDAGERQLPEGYDAVDPSSSQEERAYCREVCRIVDSMSDDDVVLLTAIGMGDRPTDLAPLGWRDQRDVSRYLYRTRARLARLVGDDG